MWNRKEFGILSEQIPFDIDVRWDTAPSQVKYGNVSSLLVVLLYFAENSGSFFHLDGSPCTNLVIQRMRRRLTDQRKRDFTIVGHNTGLPLLLIEINQLLFEIYFNFHLFVEAETTYRQYFPSASVIVRCRNFLQGIFTRSPGSWGPDVITMSYDWDGALILESSPHIISAKYRKNFRGFKLVPSRYKYLITQRKLPQSECTFLSNNGFQNILLAPNATEGKRLVHNHVHSFKEAQVRRLGLH